MRASAGPLDVDLVDGGGVAEAEVETGIVLREIAGARYALLKFTFCAGEEFNFCADAIAIAFCSDELDCKPVARVAGNVVNELGFGAQIDEECVDLAVVVVISEARAASHGSVVDHGAGGFRYVGEAAAAEAFEQCVFLRNEMNEAAVEDEEIEDAVVVEVEETGSPTDVLSVGLRNAVARADIFEAQLAAVAQHAIVMAVRDPKVEHAASFDVGENGAHG